MQGIKQLPSLRFWQHVLLTNSCWIWLAATRGKMHYGAFWVETRHVQAHRFAYELFKGKIPEGMTIDHLCKNPKCVNPMHLEVVSRGENTLRGNTITALNLSKTYCVNGHALIGDNLHMYGNKRICRACKRETMRRIRQLKEKN